MRYRLSTLSTRSVWRSTRSVWRVAIDSCPGWCYKSTETKCDMQTGRVVARKRFRRFLTFQGVSRWILVLFPTASGFQVIHLRGVGPLTLHNYAHVCKRRFWLSFGFRVDESSTQKVRTRWRNRLRTKGPARSWWTKAKWRIWCDRSGRMTRTSCHVFSDHLWLLQLRLSGQRTRSSSKGS